MSEKIRFVDPEGLVQHRSKGETWTRLAPAADIFTPHTGPTGLVEATVQFLVGLAHNRAVEHAGALAEVMKRYNDGRFRIALNFDVGRITMAHEAPECGTWFTSLIDGKLYMFWHPDPGLKLHYQKCVHHGRGKDVYSRVRQQRMVLAGLLT